MSHGATNWAITQRGLKPAARIVLWHLADCHNPRMGCFPSQEWLADACEMSRSTVNLQLEKLEAAGLIRRAAGRCPETGKQLATRYMLGFEIEEETQDVVDPCPEIGHGQEAETVSENGENPCPKNDDIRVRKSDSNPVREPVREPVIERERASADEGQEGEPAADSSKPDPATVPGRAEFEKRVMRFCNGTGFDAGPWPDWDTSTPGWIGRQFARLSEQDRLHGERWRDAYLRDIAIRKKRPVPVGAFFRDRLWEGLDPELLLKASRAAAQGAKPAEHARPEGWATGFGPVWAVALFETLLGGPDRPHPKPDGGIWFAGLVRSNWPALAALHGGRGFVASERLHRLKDAMEFVPEGGDVWAAWQAEARARDWPDWPRKDGMNGLYFPKGGPEGLAAFEQALAKQSFASRADGAPAGQRTGADARSGLPAGAGDQPDNNEAAQ